MRTAQAVIAALLLLAVRPAAGEDEVKIGQTMPYSGPVSAAGTFGLAERAYYDMLNARGGVHGRRITLISHDDGYSPPKTIDETRRLVEEEHVLAIVGTVGTPTNSAVQKYLNQAKVPQLFISSGATKWGDPQHFPWTMGWQPTYQSEGRAFTRYTLEHVPDPKIAILYQNDDFGRDYVKGFKDGLGADAARYIIAETTYETSDPTVDSQIVSLQASDATVFLNVTTQKFAAQAIRKAYDIGWKPLQFVTSIGASIGTVLKPAGVERAKGIISARYLKDTTDPTWENDKGMQDFLAFMKDYLPNVDVSDAGAAGGYSIAMTFAEVLRQCGDDVSRENIMRQAANLRHLELPMLLPGIAVDTAPDNFFPIRQLRLSRFNGETWVLFGGIDGP
ncbi:MAG TPA: ABC transporter substrate-binding protein [Stellaceae bacterium]|nr:ABC transporter substrate-binding protein [Stellaceae bacterium]